MEQELAPREKPLPYKVKAMSRESPSQKATHVIDPDLRTHWSTGTNTKEWILLELDEPCLLSHMRIYNKSVLEWEISVGLSYKPETFVKVRPRCEAPRRDMIYPMNYTPCRYVRISCLRGNPIAVFFIQLIGVSVTGLEPEFQPIVNYLLPQIVSHRQDAHDMHLQLLQDVTDRLLIFLPQFEMDLVNFSELPESNMRFFAMLVGPFYPILRIVNDREMEKNSLSLSDSDALRSKLSSSLTVSSNFEAQPRRSRSPSALLQCSPSYLAFRPESVFLLLRKAYKDAGLGIICRTASRALQKLTQPAAVVEDASTIGDPADVMRIDDDSKAKAFYHSEIRDYSTLFGDDFKGYEDQWDVSYINLLDLASVEEGILHVLFACASQYTLCCKLADNISDFWSVLPLIQALLPALRPLVSSPVVPHLPDQVDDNFSHWKHPFTQRALYQIAIMVSSSEFRPLLHAAAAYLSSFSPLQAKAACVLIDLCAGPLAPWIPTVIAKVDLAIELLEDLLGIIQHARNSLSRARACLKYILLALSGHMDEILAKYKEVKHQLLFLVEMLEPFLDPAITATKSVIAFGEVSTVFLEKQEQECAIALNIIQAAVRRPAVLPSLESEWRRGSVAPSVLLSILGPHMPLPTEIDTCKYPLSTVSEQDESEEKHDLLEANVNNDIHEDVNMLFAPSELKNIVLGSSSKFGKHCLGKRSPESSSFTHERILNDKSTNEIRNNFMYAVSSMDYFNFQADYLQLVDLNDCKRRASDFRRLAVDLHSQQMVTPEGHEAAIVALLLAAECYINPFFMISFRRSSKLLSELKTFASKLYEKDSIDHLGNDFKQTTRNIEAVEHLEKERDKIVLEILLQAAELDRDYHDKKIKKSLDNSRTSECSVKISPIDLQSADAVTLVRQNQALLCHFLTQWLLKEQNSSHEVLLQSLIFYLLSATELFCPPENIISIILQSTEKLNMNLISTYNLLKNSSTKVDTEIIHGIHRHWILLQRLVTVASGSLDESRSKSTRHGFQFGSFVPFSSWVNQIPTFSVSSLPLVRYFGWKAMFHFANQYLQKQLFIALDLSQLSSLLSIFSDDLALIDSTTTQKVDVSKAEVPDVVSCSEKSGYPDGPALNSYQDSFSVFYPELHKFFPDVKMQFRTFGEKILEAVGLRLKSLPTIALPDILCWFSGLCNSPFLEKGKEHVNVTNSAICWRGHSGRNAKVVILYILESIVSEHMEAMLPELPRLALILASLCKASYVDAAFLDSVLRLLKPLISYALSKKCDGKKLVIDPSRYDFETLCFEELFNVIRSKNNSLDGSTEIQCQGSLVIFILAVLFPDLSLQRKKEILQSLQTWANFTSFEQSSSFFDYLCAFQNVVDSCDNLLVQILESLGIQIPDHKSLSYGKSVSMSGDNSNYILGHSEHADQSQQSTTVPENLSSACSGTNQLLQREFDLSLEDMGSIIKYIKGLFSKLYPAIEFCWMLHFRLALKLSSAMAKCYISMGSLTSVSDIATVTIDSDSECTYQYHMCDSGSRKGKPALQEITSAILNMQENHCWQVASAMLDYLLGLPEIYSLNDVIPEICLTIRNFCCQAPRISWRARTDHWLSLLSSRDSNPLLVHESSVGDLFCMMLEHSEPEQRSIALWHLGRLIDLDMTDGVTKLSCMALPDPHHDEAIFAPDSAKSKLVSYTWDKVSTLASSDPLMSLRANSMALLSGYIPFAERSQLQSFFIAADRILPGLGAHLYPIQGPVVRLSLCLLACACLYSAAEDISLIPGSVWRKLETMKSSKSDGFGGIENEVCRVLCDFRTEVDSSKGVLSNILSSISPAKPHDPHFSSIRESILQVISSASSIQSYFEFFTKRAEQENQELEEAEIEMDILQKDKSSLETSEKSSSAAAPSMPVISYQSEASDRLYKLRTEIRNMERSKLREEIVARRQKKLLVRHIRQKYLEEAALHEMELLQELDRERTAEVAREIERQRLLEVERAKTKEMRHNLEMERERQSQRDLQRELEQAEAGVQITRKEFSNTSRTRERYRDRDNGRSVHEVSARPSSHGSETNMQPATSGSTTTSSPPTLLLAGSRSFSSQPPTILQSRDKPDDRSTGNDDVYEGNRDLADVGSVGESDNTSSFDGMTGGFGAAARQGSRASRSRQVVERRERDGKREGKWERKHA